MWKGRLKVAAMAALWILLPSLVPAHGDDEVKLNSFFGPVVAILTILVFVPMGKALIRTIRKEKRP